MNQPPLFSLEGSGFDFSRGCRLAERVDEKYRPAFDRYSEKERAAAALYFFPHTSKKAVLEPTRPRVVKWYCPFADQRSFPSGHRYCVNVYTGCEHNCVYCYANGYLVSAEPKPKTDFRRLLLRDIDDLERFDVPPAPIHLSNSTELFQPIEAERQDALFTLQRIREHRHRFTSVVVLTKNPSQLLDDEYFSILHDLNGLDPSHRFYGFFEQNRLPSLRLECSVAFFRDGPGRLFDPCAPPVSDRMRAIRELSHRGIPVTVRIDPLFPHDPLPDGKTLSDFGLPDFQSSDDLGNLVEFCVSADVWRIVYSVAKITRPRVGQLSETMQNMLRVYRFLGGDPVFRGGSWRLPHNVAETQIVKPFRTLCNRAGVPVLVCMENLLKTR